MYLLNVVHLLNVPVDDLLTSRPEVLVFSIGTLSFKHEMFSRQQTSYWLIALWFRWNLID